MSRRLFRRTSTGLALVLVLLVPTGAVAQDASPQSEPNSSAISTLKFLAGAGVAFGMHECGHLALDIAFDANPHLKKVEFGSIPFFAVAHDSGLSPRREFAVSSAGFWVQHATDEWLLTTRPHLRDEHAPFAKGMLAFNVLTSVGYSMAAFARVGPFERDTRGMADSIRVDEPVIGALILSPAVLDAYRYYRPRSTWAKWMSRAVKAGGALLILK
jgi:hypothetical protein